MEIMMLYHYNMILPLEKSGMKHQVFSVLQGQQRKIDFKTHASLLPIKDQFNYYYAYKNNVFFSMAI